MGVPSLYRWLVGKYPKIVANSIEEADCVDSSLPNPNGAEFDNLYLDMNGIIHQCFHSEEQIEAPKTYEEVFASIFEYTDRIFNIVRPRKLLFMAIDGVAPRAKMNQQRARRYRTAKDAERADLEEERLRKEFERAGKQVLPKQEYEVSDSNVITPGTEFMDKLAKVLEYYIRLRLNNDPGWKSIKVILSDANVPGEGEHKIMSFIRLQRNLLGYNPETHHVLYGLDADLIMLALATHEIHFTILREDVLTQTPHENVRASLNILSEQELKLMKSRQWFPKVFTQNSRIPKKPYQFVKIDILREYLELDMKVEDTPTDFERIVDDFIFMCFFSGNDFLPHLPTLEIHECAIDLLMVVYKKIFKTMGGYLVDTSRIKEKNAAYIKVKRVEKFIEEVGRYEENIFLKRYNLRQRKMERLLRQKMEEDNINDFDKLHLEDTAIKQSDCRMTLKCRDNQITISSDRSKSPGGPTPPTGNLQVESIGTLDVLQNTKELKQKLKDHLRSSTDLFKQGVIENDKVKLGCAGWKGRYYKEKFSAMNPTEIESVRKQIVEKYMDGLGWVLHYYFAGVKSWSWYYPYYFGPFASDLRGLSCPKTELKIGKPFKPFDQLMAVLPPRSMNALPKAYRDLMNSEDSILANFYCQDFEVDMDGKRFTWQGVCKLPFIDEEKLLSATRTVEKDLKVDELERNSFKDEKIFVKEPHDLSLKIASIKKIVQDSTERKGTRYQIEEPSSEVNGFISLRDDCSGLTSPVRGMESIINDLVRSAYFCNPDFHDHIPRPLTTVPEKTITEQDIMETKLWHECWGSRPPATINKRRYAQNTELPSKSVASSTQEIRLAAGSGWSGAGRGKASAESSHTNQYGRSYDANQLRNSGRGHGYVEINRRPDYRPVTRAGNGGRASSSQQVWRATGNSGNQFSRGSHRGQVSFQRYERVLVADRSENWRQTSMHLPSNKKSGESGDSRFASDGGGDRGSRW